MLLLLQSVGQGRMNKERERVECTGSSVVEMFSPSRNAVVVVLEAAAGPTGQLQQQKVAAILFFDVF